MLEGTAPRNEPDRLATGARPMGPGTGASHLLLLHDLEILLVPSLPAGGQALAHICRPLDLAGSDHHLSGNAG